MNDLTGKVFGKLTAIERVGTDSHGNATWRCLCDCGNTVEVLAGSITSGNTKSCGCLRFAEDLTGRVFGKLTVIERVGVSNNGSILWKCVCECGNIVEVIAQSLRSGNTKSCGCLRSPDLKGKVFGKLTVIEPKGVNRNGNALWKCVCECGNTVDIPAGSLIAGKTKSCGCIKSTDLTGQVFGKLTVIEKAGSDINRNRLWKCLCDCGNTKEVIAANLLKGSTKSCGCLRLDKDLTGRVFGKLKVIGRAGVNSGGNIIWSCLCECGNTTELLGSSLKSGRTTSCGKCRKRGE